MNLHASILRPVALVLFMLGLFAPAHNILASGTSTADLTALAEGGNAMSQRILGERYAMGLEGAPKDMEKAIFWWQKAAEKGDAMALYNLGVACSQGSGVPQDKVLAHKWFSLAEATSKDTASGRQGKKKAENERKSLEVNMTPAQIEEARALARDWLEKYR